MPPTTTDWPLSSACRSNSIAAKNASKFTCKIVRILDVLVEVEWIINTTGKLMSLGGEKF